MYLTKQTKERRMLAKIKLSRTNLRKSVGLEPSLYIPRISVRVDAFTLRSSLGACTLHGSRCNKILMCYGHIFRFVFWITIALALSLGYVWALGIDTLA